MYTINQLQPDLPGMKCIQKLALESAAGAKNVYKKIAGIRGSHAAAR